MNKKSLSILAYLVAVIAVLYLLSVKHLFARHWVFIGVQAGAVILMIWARLTFGVRSFHASANTSKGKLITNGPYRYWRHPIYTSIIYFVWAGQFHSPALLTLLASLVVTFALFARMILEENFLIKTYPEYKKYMEKTKRIIPFLF